MARGVDLWAAELVLERRETNPSISLFCAIQYEDFEKKWSDQWCKQYLDILTKANGAKVFQSHFTYGSFRERNCWMVDHSERVIAVFNGQKGGTNNTLDYANKVGKSILVIDG